RRSRARVPHALELEMAEQDPQVRVAEFVRARVNPFLPELAGDRIGVLARHVVAELSDPFNDLLRMQVRQEDESDLSSVDFTDLGLGLSEHPDVGISAVVIQGGRSGGAPRLVVVAPEDPDLDAGGAQWLGDIL